MYKTLWITFFLLGNLIAEAQLSADSVQRIDQLFTRWNNATPGGVITIERNGKVIYNKAFGLADLEHNVPNTTASILEAGSVSKQFTAAALLLLVQEGKVSLDDDVRKYIPELPVYEAPIRVRHLMNHTSGLKDWGSVGALSGWPRTTRVYTLELALQIICRQQSLNFEPGTEYSYSNAGYSLMVAIVERVSGQTLADFTRIRLFEPAGMKNTRWRNNFREVVPNRSVAYRRTAGTYEQEMPFEHVHGHGGLLTTTEDLITWNHQLANPTIGGSGLAALRTEQGKLKNGSTISYAGGLFIGKHNGYREITHTGATAAYRAVLSWYPEKKLGIAILSNDGSFNPGSYNTQIAEVFLGKAAPAPAPTHFATASDDQLRRYNGIYRSVRGFDVIKLNYEAGKVSSNTQVLKIIHPDTLYLDRQYWVFKKPGQILVKSPGDTNTYVRVNPPINDTAALKSLEGNYRSDEADVTYAVELRGKDLWINNRPNAPYKLNPSFRDAFMSEDRDLYEFKRNKKGAVERLVVSTGRAERIVFVKINIR